MLAGGLAPYLALAVKKATTDEKDNVNMPANIAGHALAGAAGGELAAHAIMAELYPNSTVDSLTNEQKANISALSTLAGALAGGVAGNSSNAIDSGAVAGKVAVENNALAMPLPAPIPMPGVPLSPGDKVTKDANDKMASGLDDLFNTLDKATQCNFGRACSSDDTEQSTGPNAGKNLTDAEKAELGGMGSGTPGGWGPENEENGRNQQSNNSTSGKNAESIGRDIADGHAFDKHVIEQNEYADLGIKTKEQFAQHIENVVKNPTSTKELTNGRSAYWDQSSGTVVIRNPKAADGGTAFRPTNGRAYFDNLR